MSSSYPQTDLKPSLPGDIILFSTADWDHPFWTNKQHVTMQLAKKGFRVLYVETLGLRRVMLNARDFTRICRRLIKGIRGVRRVQDRIWVYSPLVIPAHEIGGVKWINRSILEGYLHLITKWLGFGSPIVWTYNPLVRGILPGLRAAMLVYHCVDNLSSAPGMPSESILKAENLLLSQADVVFTTSPELQRRCTRVVQARSHYFPNVADFDHFSIARRNGPIPEDLSNIPSPRIGFVGAISRYKVDLDLVAEVATRRPEWNWVMIGQVGEGDPSTAVHKLSLPNVHVLGPRRYADLPLYLRGFDACALPCTMNDYTQSMFPMKFFEYLSAGKPVVASRLDALAEYAQACYFADSAEELIGAVERILAGDLPDQSLCLELARRNTWDRRTEEMTQILRQSWGAGAHARSCARLGSP